MISLCFSRDISTIAIYCKIDIIGLGLFMRWATSSFFVGSSLSWGYFTRSFRIWTKLEQLSFGQGWLMKWLTSAKVREREREENLYCSPLSYLESFVYARSEGFAGSSCACSCSCLFCNFMHLVHEISTKIKSFWAENFCISNQKNEKQPPNKKGTVQSFIVVDCKFKFHHRHFFFSYLWISNWWSKVFNLFIKNQ